jgi:2-dehydro-3-deoxygalactonokinase
MEHETLPADLFGVRAGVLLGQAKKEDAPSYASGLLIGADVRIGLSTPFGAQVVVMGRPELTRLYAAAVAEHGRDAIELDGEQCFLAGIRDIAKRIHP